MNGYGLLISGFSLVFDTKPNLNFYANQNIYKSPVTFPWFHCPSVYLFEEYMVQSGVNISVNVSHLIEWQKQD